MDIKELIKNGQLGEARAALVNKVKNRPGDPASRTLLFQVLLFCGEWDKANRHLEILAELDSQLSLTVAQYQNLLTCERQREAVCTGRELPSYLPEPPAYFHPWSSACQALRQGDDDAAARLQEVAANLPVVSGTINGEEFIGMRNADDTLAHALEIFAHDRYVWVPFEDIRELTVNAPQSLLDLMWIPASLTTWGGLSMNGFLPVLYPLSAQHSDDQVRLGRMTDWIALGAAGYRGVGQQLFLFGETDIPLLEIREMRGKAATPTPTTEQPQAGEH